MKSVLIVGLGRFGRHMAVRMSELGNDVMAVDLSETKVNDVLPYITAAQIGDSTSEQFMSALGVRNFDLCVVAIGDNFQASLESAALLKDLGAKFVLARACRDVQEKFLLRNGADAVVYAEKEMALRLAVEYSSDSVFDFIALTPDYSIYEVSVPRGWAGKSIAAINVRSKHHVSILATKVGDELFPQPAPDYVFEGSERLIIMGKNEHVRALVK